MIDQQFDGSLSLMQLKCSGMTIVLELMQHGYPTRAPFGDLYNTYQQYLPKKLQQLTPRSFCEVTQVNGSNVCFAIVFLLQAILQSLNLNDKDYKFGVSKVFFRPGKYAEFDTIMKSDPENLQRLVNNVSKWLIKSKWWKVQYTALTVIKRKRPHTNLPLYMHLFFTLVKYKILYRRELIINMQKNIRGYLARKRHGPRINGLRKINALNKNIKQLEKIASQLKKEKDSSLKSINNLGLEIQGAIKKIKDDHNISLNTIETMQIQLTEKVNKEMLLLQKKVQDQKNAEEQERLRKIQEEMERERKRKEEEERRLREEEENRRKKAEIEARRKKEEEELKKRVLCFSTTHRTRLLIRNFDL